MDSGVRGRRPRGPRATTPAYVPPPPGPATDRPSTLDADAGNNERARATRRRSGRHAVPSAGANGAGSSCVACSNEPIHLSTHPTAGGSTTPQEAALPTKRGPALPSGFMAEATAAHRPASQVLRELMRETCPTPPCSEGVDQFLRRKVSAARPSKSAGLGRSTGEGDDEFVAWVCPCDKPGISGASAKRSHVQGLLGPNRSSRLPASRT